MLKLRPITDDDHTYILSTFSHGKPNEGLGVSLTVVTGLFMSCLSRHGGTIACDSLEPSEIVGWICNKPNSNLIFWIYVRAGFRHRDIGHMLLISATNDVDLVTPFNVSKYVDLGWNRLIQVETKPLLALT